VADVSVAHIHIAEAASIASEAVASIAHGVASIAVVVIKPKACAA
jgi:hypothetical protein